MQPFGTECANYRYLHRILSRWRWRSSSSNGGMPAQRRLRRYGLAIWLSHWQQSTELSLNPDATSRSRTWSISLQRIPSRLLLVDDALLDLALFASGPSRAGENEHCREQCGCSSVHGFLQRVGVGLRVAKCPICPARLPQSLPKRTPALPSNWEFARVEIERGTSLLAGARSARRRSDRGVAAQNERRAFAHGPRPAREAHGTDVDS